MPSSRQAAWRGLSVCQWGGRSPFVVCHSAPCLLACLGLLSAISLSANTGGAISGAVLSVTGEPVASARISLVEQTTRFHRELLSDQSGKYAVEGLPPGAYTVTVTSVFTSAEQPVVVRDGETLNLPLVLDNRLRPISPSRSPRATP